MTHLYWVYLCLQLWYKFSRVRRKFGAPVCFSESNIDAYIECVPFQDSRFRIKQMQRDFGMQAVPRMQSSSSQTQWYASVLQKGKALTVSANTSVHLEHTLLTLNKKPLCDIYFSEPHAYKLYTQVVQIM